MEGFNFQPIGTFHSDLQQRQPFSAPRQPEVTSENLGFIQLQSGHLFEQALKDLDGFERIWVIFLFHKNNHWKPLTLPPRGTDQKRGVFSTRSPYRPNPIGLSNVPLIKVHGLKVYIKGADLLEGTPVLDLKPYLPEIDAFPHSKVGWIADVEQKQFQIEWSTQAQRQLQWLEEHQLTALKDFVRRQLEFSPTDSDRKRVRTLPNDFFELCYRTWRIYFQLKGHSDIEIIKLSTGYSETELMSSADLYEDKSLHRKFVNCFSTV